MGVIWGPNMSKLSFQYGFRVFLMTEVVRVCSPPMVATANGSGNPAIRSTPVLYNRVKEPRLTEDITFVETVGRDDYECSVLIQYLIV